MKKKFIRARLPSVILAIPLCLLWGLGIAVELTHDTQSEFLPGTFYQTVLEGTETEPEIRLDSYTSFNWTFDDDDITGWTFDTFGAGNVAEESPTGQIHLSAEYISGTEAYAYALNAGATIPNTFVAEYRVYFDVLETTGVTDPFVDQPTGACQRFDMINSLAGIRVDVFTDRFVSFTMDDPVDYPTNAYFDITTNTGQWYTIRFEADFTDSNMAVQVYRDDIWIGELKADTSNAASNTLRLLAYSRGSLSGLVETHIDWAKIGQQVSEFYSTGTYTSEPLNLNVDSFNSFSWTEPAGFYPWGTWQKYSGNPVTSGLIENILHDIDDPLQQPIQYDGKYWVCYATGGSPGYIRLAYSTDPDLLVWTDYEANPVLSPTGGESYVFSPHIFKEGSTYYLVYDVSEGGTQRNAYATASAPTGPYIKGQIILDVGTTGEWDDLRVTEPYIFKEGGTYFMFYMGDHGCSGCNEQIGLATTTEALFPLGPEPGGLWTKYGADGLIFPYSSDPTAWDRGLTADPSIIKVGSTYYMRYTGSHANVSWQLGAAWADSPYGPWNHPDAPEITLGPPGAWDDNRLVRGAIHYHNGGYISPYTGCCGYQGGMATADSANSTDQVLCETRTSADSVSWEAWQPVTNGGVVSSTPDEYFQYRATFNAYGRAQSPVLTGVTIDYEELTGSETDPPVITLNSPDDAAITTNTHMMLDIDVSDASPTTVTIYADSLSSPAALVYVEENVSGTQNITYDLTALRLEPEVTDTRGLWHFDEGSGTSVTDASSYGNGGTFFGDPEWTDAGKFGYALDFDGTDDYLIVADVDNSLDIDPSGALTLEAWVYPDTTGGGIWRCIMAKRGLGSSDCNYEMCLNSSSGNLLFYNGSTIWNSSVNVPQDQWSYVAITWDVSDSIAHFYRNGIEGDTIHSVSPGAVNDVPLYIGMANSTVECFDGLIEEVRVTSRALSPTEIQNNYELVPDTYYWYVYAEDDSSNNSTSATRSFEVQVAAPETDPPVITLNSPADAATTIDHFMQLSTTVNDTSPPMSVWIYGGTDSDPQTLLLADTSIGDGATLTFDWNAQRLIPETGHTIGLWHFDNYAGSTVYDSSDNVNDGSFLGDASWTWDGRFGYAIEFDGSDCALSIPDNINNSLDIDSLEGALTVEAWIYPYAVANGYHTVVCKRAGASINYQVSLDNTTGNLLFYSGHWPQVFVSDIYISADTWSYIAVTVDVTSGAGDAIFYLNGTAADTIVDTVVFGSTNDGPLLMGVNNIALTEEFDGIMDEIRLTNRALSASEIAANYELGLGDYYWKVIAEDSLDNLATSAIRTFSVVADLPDIPSLYAPVNGIYVTTQTPTFEWESTAGVGGTYTLEYAQDDIFTTGLVTITDLTDTVYTIPGGSELAEGDWYWHVQAHNGAGASGYQVTPFSFTLDSEAPDAPTGFTVEPGHEKCKLSWSNPTGDASFAGVEIRRNPWDIGAYPEYDDSGAALGYPADETDGVQVYQGPAEVYRDSSDTGTMPRNVYYYSIFSYDLAGNYSTATSTEQGRATNYWLGDVSGDGNVYFEDLTLLSNTFWTSDGDGNYNSFFDIGPTYSGSWFGIPTTDDVIDFEDLVIFAINYATVDPDMKSVRLFSGDKTEGLLGVSIATNEDRVEIGDELTVHVNLDNNPGQVKGLYLEMPYDQSALELLSVEKSQELTNSPHPYFFDTREIENGRIGISLVLLGGKKTIGGSGEIVSLRFRLLKQEELTFRFETIDIRDADNNRLLARGVNQGFAHSSILPKTFGLSQNYPNPYNMATVIAYQLPSPERVNLNIYNIRGQLVKTLVDEEITAGYHSVIWDGRNNAGQFVSSGIYLYRLKAGHFGVTRKMVLLK